MRLRAIVLLLILFFLQRRVVAVSPPQHIVFPNSPSVINVKTDCQAKGDGQADDTAALQKALDLSCGPKTPKSAIVYIPNGIYRLTRTLVVNRTGEGAGLGPWLYGETQGGSILRMDDGVKAVKAVLRTHPLEEGKTSANWFMRNIYNFTIDVGNNPEIDGIRYMANNTGIIKDVTIKGNGKYGINAAFIAESGPNMVQDVEISGFETGIKSFWAYGQTLSRISIRNCRKTGVHVMANVVAIEDLRVENTPQALFVDYPNDWTWWSGVVALVGGEFKTTGSKNAAILNKGILFARDVKAEGFSQLLKSSEPKGDVTGTSIKEYISRPTQKLFDDSTGQSLRLPMKREPLVPWETNPANWVNVSDYGAVSGDNQDDTAAIQKALDSAAKTGKTTVYFPSVGGSDPNWFDLKGEVYIRGSVRHIIGLGFGRVINGRFVISDDSAKVVKVQNIDSFGGPPPTFENRSKSNILVVESVGGKILGTGKGDIFSTNGTGHIRLTQPGQSMWARGLNPEGTVDDGLVRNQGGNLWILGSKTEGKGLRYLTNAGGRTELFGAYEYATESVEANDLRPIFMVDNATVSIAAVREVNFNGKPFVVKVLERRGSEIRRLTQKSNINEWALFSATPIHENLLQKAQRCLKHATKSS
jgi:Pectate lyase superfamily protein